MQPTQAAPERLWHNTIRTALQQYLSRQPKARFAAALAQSFRSDRDPSRPCNSAHYLTEQYEICVKGHLDQRWSHWFEGLKIALKDNGETQLSGPVVDQAALYGLLIKVRDLGLPLVSVLPIQSEQTEYSDPGEHP